MDVHSIISNLKQRGVVNAGSPFFSQDEAEELSALAKNIFETMPLDHPDRAPGGTEGVTRLPQHHPRVAELFNQIFSNSDVKFILESVLGQDYKVWQIVLRRSSPGDKGLNLHQDAPGQFDMCILFSDNMDGSGATAFLPGSHLVPTRMKDWRIETPPRLLMLIRFLFTPFTGKKGDVGFFFNRTWHARFSNTSNNFQYVCLIGLFPAGGYLEYEGYGDWSPEFLSEIQGTELSRLVDPSIGTERQSNGRYKVLSRDREAKPGPAPYAFAIETDQDVTQDFKLGATVIFLRILMGIVGPFADLFRKMVRK